MDNLKIALCLHWYQPWWQFPHIIEKICRECYEPILSLIEEIDGFSFSANINLSLLEHLEKYRPDILERFKNAVQAGKLELVASTAQHPILPLIPESVQRLQIEQDIKLKEEHFGIKHNCGGFFLPEMAFSPNLIELLKSYKCEWTITDDVPFGAHYGRNSVPFNKIVSLKGFKVFMRSNHWSNMISSGKYSFWDIKNMMESQIPNWTGNVPAYLIIAMDGETFGHWHPHLIDNCLRPMLKEWSGLPAGQAGKKIVSIESLLSDFSERKVHYLPEGSWSTFVEDIERNNPFPLWSSFSRNRYFLWKLVNTALEHLEQAPEDCLKITSSCHWWWISRSGNEPDFMKKGAELAMNIIREHGTREEADSVEECYEKLMKVTKVFVNND